MPHEATLHSSTDANWDLEQVSRPINAHRDRKNVPNNALWNLSCPLSAKKWPPSPARCLWSAVSFPSSVRDIALAAKAFYYARKPIDTVYVRHQPEGKTWAWGICRHPVALPRSCVPLLDRNYGFEVTTFTQMAALNTLQYARRSRAGARRSGRMFSVTCHFVGGKFASTSPFDLPFICVYALTVYSSQYVKGDADNSLNTETEDVA